MTTHIKEMIRSMRKWRLFRPRNKKRKPSLLAYSMAAFNGKKIYHHKEDGR